MQMLTPEDQLRLQRELESDESILWSGKPNPRVVFHFSDLYMIPFSLLWGGFAIFWEHGATHGFHPGDKAIDILFALWGVPFVVMGQYVIWGRFFYAAWRKRRVLYAVTSRRILVFVTFPRRKSISAFLDTLPTFDKDIRSDGIGTLKFGQISGPFSGARNSNFSWDGLYLNAGIPIFVDIDDADSVVSLITSQRNEILRRPGHAEPPKPRFL